jgi:hypothetical protein
VGLHLPGGQALRRQRDDQLVHPGQPPLPLGHDPRLEAAVAVARHVDLDRPNVGQHRLSPAPVAGVRAVAADRVVLAIAEVIGQLTLQGGLQQPLGQLLQQPALPGQLQPAGAGSVRQLLDQLLVQRIHALGRRRRVLTQHGLEIHSRLGHHVSHRVHTP